MEISPRGYANGALDPFDASYNDRVRAWYLSELQAYRDGQTTPPLELPPEPILPEDPQIEPLLQSGTARRPGEDGGTSSLTEEDMLIARGLGTRVDEDEQRMRCQIGSYRTMSRLCGQRGMQAHHIVPDWTLRTGTRAEAERGEKRIEDMPGFWEGNAICLAGRARTEGTEHNLAHLADGPIEAIGVASDPPNTATVRQVTTISIAATAAVRPECLADIVESVNEQFPEALADQLLRAKQYPPLHPRAITALESGARRGAAGNP